MTANAVATKPPVQTFGEFFIKKSKALAGLIPKHLTPDRVAKIAISALMRNPGLLQCKMETVWFQVAQAASLGLEVNLLGSAYLVPFKNKNGGKDCQLIVGYQGLIDLARRSGNIQSIEARIVKERDEFEISYGLEPTLHHRPYLDGDAGKMRLVYAIAILKDGGRQIEIMTKAEVDEIRNRSRAASSGPWVTDYNEMARKTVIRRIAKYLPKSIELSQAITLDDAGDAGEPQLAGLDVENFEVISEAEIISEEESETEKLKSELKNKQKNTTRDTDTPSTSPVSINAYKSARVKLSMMYAGREDRIDDSLKKHGANAILMDIRDEADEKTMRAVIKTAEELQA